MSTKTIHRRKLVDTSQQCKRLNGHDSLPTAANGHTEGSKRGCQDGEENGEGWLLRRVLDLVLETRLVTGIDPSESVVSFKHPHELLDELDLEVAVDGCSAEGAARVLQTVVKYSVKTQHPYFYNQLYGGIDEVALSGAWLTESLNTNQYTFEVGPVFVLVEHKILQNLISLFGWSEGDGIFAPGGSISNMYGMALARYKHRPDIRHTGMSGHKPLVLFTSDQSHYSFQKGASWLGLGMNNVVSVATDAQGRMLPDALREAVTRARKEGKEPFMVNATAGTTVLGAFDPLEEVAKVCEKEELWFHVDACWGGSVILSRKHKHFLDGINRADSISWNPHKMLGVSMQCSVFITRHKDLLAKSNSACATYLFQQDKFYDVSFDTGDKSLQCSRKVDGFKLWLFMKVHGLSTLETRIDAAFHASRHLAEEAKRRVNRFRLVEKRQCTNVCFWFIPESLRGKEETSEWWSELSKVAPAIKERMVKKGSLLVGYCPIPNKGLVNFFRMVTTCVPTPTTSHMDYVLDEIERLGEGL